MTINPHINFNGNAEEAFAFYQTVLGGEFTKMVRYRDLDSSVFPIADSDKNKFMLIALTISEGHVLMANDVPEVLGKVNQNENRSKISVRADSKEEADRIFAGLSEGGEIEGPMGDGPWGSYMGVFRDKYGIEWIIEA